jgi:surface protein
MLDGSTEETKNKLDALKELMYDNYTHDIFEIPTGDYHTQPWNPANYSENQIALKMTRSTRYLGKGVIGEYQSSSYQTIYKKMGLSPLSQNFNNFSGDEEEIIIDHNGVTEYYKVITVNPEAKYKTINFGEGNYIEKIISICDTSEADSMSFYGCTELVSIDCIDKINISKMTNISGMFRKCYKLTNLDLSSWNTENVTNMNHVFADCEALTTLNLSNWNTSKVTDMSYMFNDCKKLKELDLSMFDTYRVESFTQMLQNLYDVERLDLSNFYIRENATYNYMSYGCNLEFEDIIVSNCTSGTIEKMRSAHSR